jgi:putative colanic acid biosynthesis acetyltransferase WcaF
MAAEIRMEMGSGVLPRERNLITPLSVPDRLLRLLWSCASLLLFRPPPKPFHGWRRCLLRLFGADIAPTARVYPTVKIWAPWNLTLHAGACLGYYVDCYDCGHITLEENAIVSQYTFLCSATHDYRLKEFPLITKPIVIGKQAWVCAGAFIGPGVTVGEGAVVGATSSVFRDVDPWTVVGGNPAVPIKKRELWD